MTDTIEKVKYAVETTSYESLALWKEWHERVNWEQLNPGKICTVGHINDRPINVELSWNKINGHKILFYHGCSMLVDHDMVEKWLKKNALLEYPNMVDAMNFHNIVNYLPPSKVTSPADKLLQNRRAVCYSYKCSADK